MTQTRSTRLPSPWSLPIYPRSGYHLSDGGVYAWKRSWDKLVVWTRMGLLAEHCSASDSCSPDYGSEYSCMIHNTPTEHTLKPTYCKACYTHTHITPTLTETHHTQSHCNTHLVSGTFCGMGSADILPEILLFKIVTLFQ